MKKVSELFKEISDKQLNEDLRLNSGLFLFKYAGVNSADLTQLRRDLKAVSAKMFVTKNSFINLALKSTGKDKEVLDFIDGPTALVFIKDDPLDTSKILVGFAKKHTSIDLKGGYVEERIVNSQDFKVLASISSKQALYQQIAMALNGSISKLAMGLNQIVAKLVYALKSVSDNKEKEKK